MFGFGDEFDYFQCSNCGCIQIVEPPANLDKYYPATEYYAYQTSRVAKEDKNSFSQKVRKIQSDYLLFGKNKLLGSILCAGYDQPDYFAWIKKVKANYNTSILDVGCGSGDLLFRLRSNGFTNLTGVDPFIQQDILTENISIYKQEVFSLQGSFDFIMLNHAFEHMDNQLAILEKLYSLLNTGGTLLIRVPVSNAYCWQHYGVYWSSLDAPRHFFIHSEKSMDILCNKAGFTIKEVVHDATAFHFWVSEQYKKGIPLKSEKSYEINRRNSMFSKRDIRNYRKRIKELNQQHLGGDAAFYITKAS